MTEPAAVVRVGDEIAPRRFRVERINLIMYAGAGGDFNPIHWNQRIAMSVGLPDVIAHGMYTMAQIGRYVTDWAGDPGAVEEFSLRFSKPVAVPDDNTGARIEVSGRVVELLDGGRVRIDLVATSGDDEIVKAATAVVALQEAR